MECPICHKPDLLDTATHCARCGTDLLALTQFALLDDASIDSIRKTSVLKGEKTELQHRLERSSSLIFGLRARMVGYWLFFGLFTLIGCAVVRHYNHRYESLLQSQRTSLSRMHRRIIYDDTLLRNYRLILANTSPDIYIGTKIPAHKPLKKRVLFIITPGDKLGLISQFFFDSPEYAHRIGNENRISDHDLLVPGDTLIINPPQQ